MPTKKQRTKKPDRIETFVSPESSNVEGAAYDKETLELIVAYRDKKVAGAETVCYSYANFQLDDWTAFLEAESKGKYVATVLKKKYRGVITKEKS